MSRQNDAPRGPNSYKHLVSIAAGIGRGGCEARPGMLTSLEDVVSEH